MRQKPVSSGREQLNFGILACILQQRLWLVGYFEGIFVNTDTMQLVNCLQHQHWQILLGCVPDISSGPLKQQLSSLCVSLVADMQLATSQCFWQGTVTLARVETGKPAFLQTCLDTQESGQLFEQTSSWIKNNEVPRFKQWSALAIPDVKRYFYSPPLQFNPPTHSFF